MELWERECSEERAACFSETQLSQMRKKDHSFIRRVGLFATASRYEETHRDSRSGTLGSVVGKSCPRNGMVAFCEGFSLRESFVGREAVDNHAGIETGMFFQGNNLSQRIDTLIDGSKEFGKLLSILGIKFEYLSTFPKVEYSAVGFRLLDA